MYIQSNPCVKRIHNNNDEKKPHFTDYSHYVVYIIGAHSVNMCIVQQSFASHSSVSSLGSVLFAFLLWASWLGGIHGFCVLVNYLSLLPICHFVEYFYMHSKCNVVFCLCVLRCIFFIDDKVNIVYVYWCECEF